MEENNHYPYCPELLHFKVTFFTVFSSFFIIGSIRITPKDSRWVGAWWLGFLFAGLFSIISSIPFFFLPQNLDKPQKERKASASLHVLKINEEKSQRASPVNHTRNMTENLRGKYFIFVVIWNVNPNEREEYSKTIPCSNHLEITVLH